MATATCLIVGPTIRDSDTGFSLSARAKEKESCPRIEYNSLMELALSGIPFSWNERECLPLAEYKRVHGDWRVPADWPDNRKLGMWVGIQRKRRKEGKLSQERISELNEIGF